jgi:small-conductance mechanosensitive channel
MDTSLQNILNRIQADLSHTQNWIPTPRKLDTESIISAVIVLAGFWLAAVIARHIADRFFVARKIDEALARFLQRVLKFSVLMLGFVTALGTLGIDVSAIVAGLGLTGLALGIALKDIVSNAVSGIMLLIFRPFRHRDLIKMGDFEGEVIDIDMRYTHLRTEEKIIFVPNSLLFANAVTVTKAAIMKPQLAASTAKQPEALKTPEPRPMPPLAPKRKASLLSLVADDADSAAA